MRSNLQQKINALYMSTNKITLKKEKILTMAVHNKLNLITVKDPNTNFKIIVLSSNHGFLIKIQI